MKHTPIPKLVRYKYEDTSNLHLDCIRLMDASAGDIGKYHARVTVHRDLSLIVSETEEGLARDLLKANAEMIDVANGIVRAVNAHDALVEALHQISLASQNSMSSQAECGRIARKALAALTGEE